MFESNDTILIDITWNVKQTQLELNKLKETAGTVEEFDSHMSWFKFTEYEDGQKFSGTFVKYGHMLYCHIYVIWLYEKVEIQFEGFKIISKGSLENLSNKKRNVSETLQETLSHKVESFKLDFFINIEWIDPGNWLEDKNYSIPMIC